MNRIARRALVLATRPTYGRSLSFVVGRDELPRVLNRRGLVGAGAEVGVRKGEYSELLLERWRGRLLISVDAWDAAIDQSHGELDGGQAGFDELHREARERLARFGERSEIRRSASLDAAAEVDPGSLDFVYIDAAHDLESVSADIDAWYPRVRPGGLLCGHDYFDGHRLGASYGVASAVDAFCAREGLRASVTLRDGAERSWMVEVPGR